MIRGPFLLPFLLAGLLAHGSSLASTVELICGPDPLGERGSPSLISPIVRPFGVDFDRPGNLVFVEMVGGERVRKIDRRGVLSTIAGTGEKGFAGDGGPALLAKFNGMHNLAVTRRGDLLIADTWNKRVRRIDRRSGTVTTLAGRGNGGFGGDLGPSLMAEFGDIYCVTLNPQGRVLLVTDLDNRRIRGIDLRTGAVRTLAGNGTRGVPPDGAIAVDAPLVDPRAAAMDRQGRIYILERSGNALRVVETDGRIRTVAGTGAKGLSGDGGGAKSALLNGPKHLCLDRDDNVILADTENHVIRRYQPKDGRIVRVAGSGRKGAGGVGGPAASLELNQPHGVFMHRDGSLYIADTENHRILRIKSPL